MSGFTYKEVLEKQLNNMFRHTDGLFYPVGTVFPAILVEEPIAVVEKPADKPVDVPAPKKEPAPLAQTGIKNGSL